MTSQAERVAVPLDNIVTGLQIVANRRAVLSVYVNDCPVGFIAGLAFGGIGQPTYKLGLGETLRTDDKCIPEQDGVFLTTTVAVPGGVLELNVSFTPGTSVQAV